MITNTELNNQPAWKQIRCIHCGRKYPNTVLDIISYLNESKDLFECLDKHACASAQKHDKSISKVHIYFDAACQGSNTAEGQDIGIGVYVEVNKVATPEFFYMKSYKGLYTNNDGEWLACVAAYKTILKMSHMFKGNAVYRIFGDSQIVINCVLNRSKTGVKFQPHLLKIEQIKAQLKREPVLMWLKRDYNREADKLSKKALAL